MKDPARWKGASLALAAAAALAPRSAQAGGFSLARYGGIHGHANADGGLALYWNAARLALEPGLYGTVDLTVASRRASYDRVIDRSAATPDEIAYNSGLARVSTFGAIPLLALGYARELDDVNVGVAVGAFPSFGGIAEWDQNRDAPDRLPGAVDGPQRWSAIAASLTLVDYTVGAAVTLKDPGVSLGASLAYVAADLDTVKARNLNETDAMVDARGVIQEGRVHFHGKDAGVALTVGASWDTEAVTTSVHVRRGYDLVLEGPLRQAYSTSDPSTVKARVDFPVPDVVNLAVTPRFGKLETTLALEYTTWSRIETHDVFVSATGQQILEIPRDLQNTVGAKLVPGWSFDDRWAALAMIGYESSAVPPETVDASLSDAPKLLLGAGGRFDAGGLRLLFSYARDEYREVRVTSSRHRPPTNGRFDETRDHVQVTLEGRL